jgi:hypothetical protein
MAAEGAAAANPPEAEGPLATAILEDWPPRPWLLGAIGALAALLVHFLVTDAQPTAARSAGAAFLFFGAIAFALSLEPLRGSGRWREPAIFSAVLGAIMGGIAFHWVSAQDSAAGEEFAFAAGVFSSLIAVPLFQAGFHRLRWATPYRLTHFHVWTDAISGAGAVAFTLLSWLMLVLLNELLKLVGIDVIETLMDTEWFGFVWTGGAFGTALGVLRNNLKVIGSLQHVVLLVLSLLAVPLALALVVFLVALLASGGQALWDATDAATPVLLACAVGCFVLTNAVVRDDEDAITGNRVMRAVGMVLAAGVFPLAAFAAVSMGIRVGQHGLSPERLWALIAIAVAVAYGVAYWAGLARGFRGGWAERLRRANLHLAAVTCVLALVLALPLVDFGGVSARNQIARLDRGAVSAEDFDYTALRWDFGDAGRRALARLAERDGGVGEKAKAAQAQTSRPYTPWPVRERPRPGEVRMQSDDPALQGMVEDYLASTPWNCDPFCVAVDLGTNAQGQREVALVQGYGYERIVVGADGQPPVPAPETAPQQPFDRNATVEVREETGRYIYVNGKRVGQPLD